MQSQTLLLMSKSSNRDKVTLLKEGKGSELPKNIYKQTKIFIYGLKK